MMQSQTLRVVEEEPDATQARVDEAAQPSHYADADEFDLGDYGYPIPGFVRELFDELGKDADVGDARLVDHLLPTDDVDDGLLLAFPDECLLFLGKDPTAKDAMPWYAFTVEPMEPVPAPETADEALDMLKPPEVRDVVDETGWLPDRHGEWWLLPTRMAPAGTLFKPGVSSEPYGPSPLGNHVPREYGFTVSDSTFMDRFEANVPSAPSTVETPPEAIDWSFRQVRKAVPPEDAPSWAEIRDWAGDVLVRGTVRHRDDDHYVENCGEEWHRAVTHRIEVYTADALGEGVHLDYYGT